MKTLIFTALAVATLLVTPANAQHYPCWGCGYSRGYGGFGAYQAWPRRWGGWNPGVSYYGPGYYRPFSYWGRNPYYRF
jgi:hypothetical protein